MRKTRERAGFRGEIRAVIWIYVFDALETAKTKRQVGSWRQSRQQGASPSTSQRAGRVRSKYVCMDLAHVAFSPTVVRVCFDAAPFSSNHLCDWGTYLKLLAEFKTEVIVPCSQRIQSIT